MGHPPAQRAHGDKARGALGAAACGQPQAWLGRRCACAIAADGAPPDGLHAVKRVALAQVQHLTSVGVAPRRDRPAVQVQLALRAAGVHERRLWQAARPRRKLYETGPAVLLLTVLQVVGGDVLWRELLARLAAARRRLHRIGRAALAAAGCCRRACIQRAAGGQAAAAAGSPWLQHAAAKVAGGDRGATGGAACKGCGHTSGQKQRSAQPQHNVARMTSPTNRSPKAPAAPATGPAPAVACERANTRIVVKERPEEKNCKGCTAAEQWECREACPVAGPSPGASQVRNRALGASWSRSIVHAGA